MKTKEQIEAMMEESKADYAYLQEWLTQAENRFQQERNMWGNEADDGELRTVNEFISQRIAEIRVLEWVLRED